jgi:glycosyltransferase involved in cell wall biosynthesis
VVDQAISERRLEGHFEFLGPVGDERKWEVFGQADLFVLPTKSENFGIAIAEALAAGVPVITTKAAPWQELESHRCGWWVDVGVEPLAAALREATAASPDVLREMGLRGRELVRERYSWPKIAEDMKAVYEWVLGRGPRPGCVEG